MPSDPEPVHPPPWGDRAPEPVDPDVIAEVRLGNPRVLGAVVVGGALGTLARYLVERAWATPTGHFPAATFAVNTSGAFVLGAVLAMVLPRRHALPYLRPFLTTGLLGGWTTYSTFAVETVDLGMHGHAPVALAYVAASLAAGVVAAASGLALGRRLERVPVPAGETP